MSAIKLVKPFFYFVTTVIFFACSSEESKKNTKLEIEHLKTRIEGQGVSFRGLYAVNDSVVWISGNNSVIGITENGGKNWSFFSTNHHTDVVDVRDVFSLSPTMVFGVVAGQPAQIIYSYDKANTFNVAFQDDNPQAFLNGFAFFENNESGIAFGDPVNGKLTILKTKNSGNTWERVDENIIPDLPAGVAGFAASGTSIVTGKNGVGAIGLGGQKSYVLTTSNYGDSWDFSQVTAIAGGSDSQGIFSLAIQGKKIVAVGGDYKNQKVSEGTIAISEDMGRTWEEVKQGANGYKSCVQFIGKDSLIATGSNTILSIDGGFTWKMLDDHPYHTIAVSPSMKSIWLAGKEGAVAKIEK